MNISIHQPTGLWAEFHRRLNVDSFPRSSSSNTGAWTSLTRYYFTAAGYNWAEALIPTTSCYKLHVQQSQGLKIDDSRSVRKRRLVKQSTLVAALLIK